MSNNHADKEGGKGVNIQQSNQGDSLVNQQGVKSKNIKPNRQKGEDNPKRARRNPQPTQPTATDTQSIASSPEPTAAKPPKTPTDTQTTVTSPQPAAAKSQQTAADTQTNTVNPKPIGGNLQQTGDNSQQAGDNFQQAGDNPQHKDLSVTESEDMEEEGQETMTRTKFSPKENTTVRRKAKAPHVQKYTDSRSEYSDGEQYDIAEAYRIEKSRSRTDWTNQLWIPIINVIVTVIVCVVFMKVCPPWGQVQPVSTTDNSRTTKELMTMEEAIRDLRNENTKYKTMLDDTSSKIMTLDEANRRVDNLNDKFGELEKCFKTMTGTLEEMSRKIDNYSNKLSEIREQIEQVNTNISNTSTDLEEKLRQQEKTVTKKIEESNKEVSKMNDKIEKIEEEISSKSETIKKAGEATTLLQNEVKIVEGEIAFLKSHAFNKSVMLNIVVFLTIAVFALIIGLWILWNRVSFDHHGNTPIHRSGTNPRMSVIEQVPKTPPLTNTICVISYGQRNESFNHTLVDGLMRQLSQPLQDSQVRGHLINTHADIANIPPCKLIFMCVEFSTRHVIIEEPGIGQGDIRRTTYDAVRKLGATLVILYTRDPESRQLRDKLRYQKDIYCVASQPELKVLDDQKCFYSVFTSFTQSQVESLETVIRRALQ